MLTLQYQRPIDHEFMLLTAFCDGELITAETLTLVVFHTPFFPLKQSANKSSVQILEFGMLIGKSY